MVRLAAQPFLRRMGSRNTGFGDDRLALGDEFETAGFQIVLFKSNLIPPGLLGRLASVAWRASASLRPHESKSIRDAVGRKPTCEHAQIGLFSSRNIADPNLLIQRARVDVWSRPTKSLPFENCVTRAYC
jgi:hypothetical protein